MKANAAQDSADWMLARCGKFTASRASDLMARTKSGPSASRRNLLALLAVEVVELGHPPMLDAGSRHLRAGSAPCRRRRPR